GRGENRAMEAAQQAISSPLLDNVSVSGATGVLVNITGGQDLTLGEVHQINEIIHDAVGDEAEIIFGAVHEPAMQGEIRVTVIATGFDKDVGLGGYAGGGVATHTPEQPVAKIPPAVIPFPARPARPVASTPQRYAPPPTPAAAPDIPRNPSGNGRSLSNDRGQDLSDMEIPTFIRRQMD
ncbi:MAG TPA: cell division protein FtsZ, partial [Gemmatimonadaceae bacterium]|nr:cell division protein FtsZ [Gemmatimonadaceae bacterium]